MMTTLSLLFLIFGAAVLFTAAVCQAEEWWDRRHCSAWYRERGICEECAVLGEWVARYNENIHWDDTNGRGAVPICNLCWFDLNSPIRQDPR
jgi:hypothetical protein